MKMAENLEFQIGISCWHLLNINTQEQLEIKTATKETITRTVETLEIKLNFVGENLEIKKFLYDNLNQSLRLHRTYETQTGKSSDYPQEKTEIMGILTLITIKQNCCSDGFGETELTLIFNNKGQD